MVEMMGRDTFYEYIKEHILDSGFEGKNVEEVRLHEVKKNNGVILHGLIIREKDHNVSPQIYLEKSYEDYANGKSVEACMGDLRRTYEESKIVGVNPIAHFGTFETAKDSIEARIIGVEANKELLEEIPYFTFGDLALTFASKADIPEYGLHGSIKITNEHLEMWGVTKADVLEAASDNISRNQHFNIMRIEDVIGIELEDVVFSTPKMHVLTNEFKAFGAVGLLSAELLEEHAKMVDSSFYVLPSSVHEVILYADERARLSDLRDMVYEINREQVDIEERLSDNVYFYDKEAKQLFRTDTGEPMHLVDDTKSMKFIIMPEDLKQPKRESIKEKMEGYKAVVRKTEPSAKRTAPDLKKDSVRE